MKQTSIFQKTLLLVAMTGWFITSSAQQYEKDHHRVYYGEDLVEYADVRTFVDLGCGYAKDKNNVYMYGRILENVDPSTFRLKERHSWRNTDKDKDENTHHKRYYKTKWNVYYGTKKLDATASSFKELGGGYAKDSFTVFYYGEKVEGAMASSFKYTGDGYAEDSFDAYYRGKKLK